MKEFFKIYFKTILTPTQAFQTLLNNERFFVFGFIYMLIPIIGYTMMYVFLTIGHGAPSIFKPWLNISSDNYYSVNRFLLAPSMILSWFFSVSVIQVLSRIFKGKGTFEQTLSVIGLSISIAMWAGLIHDLPMSFLSAIKIINARQHEIDMNSPTIWRSLLWIAYSIYFIAFIILFTKAIRVVQQTSAGASVFLGITGFIFFQILFLVFNR